MKTTLTALIATATAANATIVHLFENEDITVRVSVENRIEIDDTEGFNQSTQGAAMRLEVINTAPGVRLNSVYYRGNHSSISGDVWSWAGGTTVIKEFDLDTPDFNNIISPDPNPFGSAQSNSAFRPWLFAGEGRGSYNFSDNRILQQDLDAENYWFDEKVDGGDQWFVYHDEFRTGSGSIGEWTFAELPMSVVYSKEKGSTIEISALGNFTDIYRFDDAGELLDDPAVPEPSAALLTLLAALGTLRRNRNNK